jgi:ribosomal RNA-processing protein 9
MNSDFINSLLFFKDGVYAMDCWTQERPVSASSDRTLRVWKVSDESHLVLRGHKGSIDAVKMMTDDTYLSGGQDGSLNLWKDTQKKPVAFAHMAHGQEMVGSARWIVSIASVKMSDLGASGSYDGFVRLWNANASENRTLQQSVALPIEGFVNSLAMSTQLVVAGTGQEHRLGRWWRMKGSLNKVVVWRLPPQS